MRDGLSWKFFLPAWGFGPAMLLAIVLIGGRPALLLIVPMFLLSAVCSMLPVWRGRATMGNWIIYGAVVPATVFFVFAVVVRLFQVAEV